MKLLTSNEYAEWLGIHPSRVRRLAEAGRIPGAMKKGRDWLIPAGVYPVPGRAGPKGTWEKEMDNGVEEGGQGRGDKHDNGG